MGWYIRGFQTRKCSSKWSFLATHLWCVPFKTLIDDQVYWCEQDSHKVQRDLQQFEKSTKNRDSDINIFETMIEIFKIENKGRSFKYVDIWKFVFVFQKWKELREKNRFEFVKTLWLSWVTPRVSHPRRIYIRMLQNIVFKLTMAQLSNILSKKRFYAIHKEYI